MLGIVAVRFFDRPSPAHQFIDERLQAAEQGDAVAQAFIGILHYGDGNFEESVKWLRRAAAQNNANAQFFLASCYRDGLGVPVDLDKARELYQLAADRGSQAARTVLERLE